MQSSIPRILVIAGSDSGGGAGIQADIKTVTMLGGHATTAVTAITAQNTLGVSDVHPVPVETILAQIDAVLSDIGTDAVKIGMIGGLSSALAVADRLESLKRERPDLPIVFDPVMVATSGSSLADEATIAAFGRFLDLATVATPNLPELATLSPARDPLKSARALAAAHGCAVLVKGGHGAGAILTDTLVAGGSERQWSGRRIETSSSHGTGCTLASAIATFLASGSTLEQAVDHARIFVRIALHGAAGLGSGAGPIDQGSVRLDCGPSPRLNQVTVGVTDFDRSMSFYRALGLAEIVVSAAKGYARFETAGGATLSIKRGSPADAEDRTSAELYFECNDLDRCVERLAEAGFAFDHEPIDQDWLWREARLRDPSGNRICLFRAGEARRFPPWRVEKQQ